MKLNKIIETYNIIVFGFSVFKELENIGNKSGDSVIISTVPPAVMLHYHGVSKYFTPIVPRGVIFKSVDEIINANLDINHISVFPASDIDTYNSDDLLIVTQHKATIDILSSIYPKASIITSSVSADDIKDRVVVGVLPPHLIQYCKAFSAATIKDYNAAIDGDISTKDLGDRLEIMSPITVKIIEI